jgi:hypothetical protein
MVGSVGVGSGGSEHIPPFSVLGDVLINHPLILRRTTHPHPFEFLLDLLFPLRRGFVPFVPQTGNVAYAAGVGEVWSFLVLTEKSNLRKTGVLRFGEGMDCVGPDRVRGENCGDVGVRQ